LGTYSDAGWMDYINGWVAEDGYINADPPVPEGYEGET
jgi:hypothetical protein